MRKVRRLSGKERHRRRAGLLAAIVSTATLYSVSAAAQSSVTLFGVVDEGVRYTTHADPQGDSRVQLANGASESLWGFKGAEDIGGGTKVVFQLENRFFPNSGATDPAYPFFNTALCWPAVEQLRKVDNGPPDQPTC